MSNTQKFLPTVKPYNFFKKIISRPTTLPFLRVLSRPVTTRKVAAYPLLTDTSNCHLLPRYLFSSALFFCLILSISPVLSAPISKTIVIDGNTSDWKTPINVTTNSGQFSTDAEGDASTGTAADLDFPVQATGRDLERFSFTYDPSFLYLWVERYASTSNKTDWWFYLDTDNDGVMESSLGHTDKLLRVEWTGSNGKTTIRLYDYDEATPGGDPLVCPDSGLGAGNGTYAPYELSDGWCPVAGEADGYDMPGTHKAKSEYTLDGNGYGDIQDEDGGSTLVPSAGVEMEIRISWGALGFTGPTSVGFHISSSNGQNIPDQINDNMNGTPGGGGGSIAFSDLVVTKTASIAGVEVSSVNAGSMFDYIVSVENLGGSNATNVSLEDVLPSGVSYLTDDSASTGTSYNATTGLWAIGSLANGATVTLTISVFAEQVASDTDVTNTANNLFLDQGDPVTTNNQDSAVVTIKSVPDILVVKASQTIEDPINGSSNPKAIPGAIVLYTITVTNQGLGAADGDSIIVTDLIPANTELFVGDLAAGLPVAWIDVSPLSGLTTISAADIQFSNSDASTYGYTPVPDADGYDAAVNYLQILPKGTFASSDGTNHPSFTLRFKVRIQ